MRAAYDVEVSAPRLRNWAGNIAFRPRRYVQPRDLDELVEIIRVSDQVRVLGTGHSFNPIADTTGTLISLDHLPREVRVMPGRTAVSAGTRYGDLAFPLHEAGWALANVGSLPHISIAGACATATHGSGDRNGCLATAVAGMTGVDGTCRVFHLTAESPEFPGAVVHLGALGAVTEIELVTEPTFTVRQWVYEDAPLDNVFADLDDVTSAAYSVSIFTTWDPPTARQIWLKERVAAGRPDPPARRWGGRLAERDHNPVPGMPPENCTPQLGRIGPWHERLPHFRLDVTPSAGDELQSEYFVPRAAAVEAYRALRHIGSRIAPVLQISEIRTVAADELWLSPAYHRPSVAFHFTWIADEEAVRPVVSEVERALAPLQPRPHWGKLFTMDPAVVRAAYPRFDDFVALAERYDPEGKFQNDFLRRFFAG